MLSLSLFAFCSTFALLACGTSEDEGTPDGPMDGPGNIKAAEVVNCTTSVTKEIKTEAANTYVPSSLTVAAGTIVRFVMHPTHDAVSRSPSGLFNVATGQTECVKFNKAGTYLFTCSPHGFQGTVIVQ